MVRLFSSFYYVVESRNKIKNSSVYILGFALNNWIFIKTAKVLQNPTRKRMKMRTSNNLEESHHCGTNLVGRKRRKLRFRCPPLDQWQTEHRMTSPYRMSECDDVIGCFGVSLYCCCSRCYLPLVAASVNKHIQQPPTFLVFLKNEKNGSFL